MFTSSTDVLVYLVAPELNFDSDVDWWIRYKDCCGQREEQQRKPDDEDEQKQQQTTETVLDYCLPLETTLERIILFTASDSNYQ